MTTQAQNGKRRLPLEGIRVLDLGTVIAAPYTAMLLADYGADVIKIEHPTGDASRRNGPRKGNTGFKYAIIGRNKRHIVLNLSTPDGQEILKGLAAKSDVVIENFRPGVMERWGIGWEQLHELNRRLVMLRVTGFGQFGPYSKRPGFGTLAEAMSGFAHINGYPDGPPTLPPFGLADGLAALSAAYAVMLALYDRDRPDGEGQMIDVALIEPLFHILGAQATIYDQTGAIQGRSGNRSRNVAPRNTYKTRDDRWLAISASAQPIAERVMRLIGRPDFIDEPWFATGAGRFEHVEEIDAILGAWIAERDLDEVMRAFEEAGAAVAPIYDISQIYADPQYQALQSIISVEDEEIGSLKMPNLHFRMSRTPGQIRHTGRRLGRDTDEVLGEILGLSPERLRELHESGVIEPAAGGKAVSKTPS